MSLFYLAFDDTDNLETIGTGHILQAFLEEYAQACEPKEVTLTYITRHQLLVDPAVPYTSHNSAMCATLEGALDEEELIDRAGAFLKRRGAAGSDPGLCVAKAETLVGKEMLVTWGKRALEEVLSKEEAYEVAQRCKAHLSEHGGTGQGVVGALAAVGLRLSGGNGRVRGKKLLEPGCLSVQELLEKTGFDRVCLCGACDADGGFDAHGDVRHCVGEALAKEACVRTETGEIKAVYLDGQSTVLARLGEDGCLELLEKQQLKTF